MRSAGRLLLMGAGIALLMAGAAALAWQASEPTPAPSAETTSPAEKTQAQGHVHPLPSGPGVPVLTEDWRPFSYEEDGVVKGSATAIVRRVFAGAKVNASLKVYPWARAYHMAQTTPGVAIYAMVRTHAREPNFHWVGQVAPTDTCSLFKLANRSAVTVDTLADARRYSIVTNKNSDKHQFLVKQGFTSVLLESDQRLTVRMLLSGRVDLLIMHDINLKPHLEALAVAPGTVERVRVVYESRAYLAFNKDTEATLVDNIRRAYNAARAAGDIPMWDAP